MADVQFDKIFAPAEATRGQYVPIDSTTLSGLPSSSRGRYAVLTYNVGMDSGVPGASASVPMYVQVVGSTTILSAFEVDATGVSGLEIRAEVEYPDTTIYASNGNILAHNTSAYDFGQIVQSIEVFNMEPTNTVYIGFNTNNLNTLSSVGLPVVAEGYYSIDRETQNIYIGNPNGATADVRVIGHYRNA